MSNTPSRVRITAPAQLLLEVAGSGTQQKIADIELPIVVLVGAGEPGTGPTVEVAPIQDTPRNLMSARDMPSAAAPTLVADTPDVPPPYFDGSVPEKESGVLGYEPTEPEGWSLPGKAAQCPNHRMHSRHTWGQIEGSPTVEEILARTVKVTHYHCPGA